MYYLSQSNNDDIRKYSFYVSYFRKRKPLWVDLGKVLVE